MSARERPIRWHRALPIAAGLALILGVPACDGAANGSSIEPGVGVTSNGLSIRIGDLRADTARRLGPPSSARDLGGLESAASTAAACSTVSPSRPARRGRPLSEAARA